LKIKTTTKTINLSQDQESFLTVLFFSIYLSSVHTTPNSQVTSSQQNFQAKFT